MLDCARTAEPKGARPMAVSEQVGARTAALIAEREQWISASVATSPVFVERAHGARLVDVDGREYIDFVGGIGTLNGGHTPERVVRAIQQQAEQLPAPVLLHRAVRAVHRGRQAPLPDPPGAGPYKGAARRTRARRPSRTPSRSRATPPGRAGRRRLRPGVPRPHAAGDDADLEGDAVQEGLRPVRARGLPRARPRTRTAASPATDAIAGVKKLFKSQIDPSAGRGR